MSLEHLYSDFGSPKMMPSIMEPQADPLEEVKLEAFEQGFNAGWEDAEKTHGAERSQMNAAVVQRMQDMTFTYHEALSNLTQRMQPLMTDVVTKLVPGVATSSMRAHLMSEIDRLTRNAAEGAIEIAAAPQVVDALREALDDALDAPFNIVADETLGDGQLFLRIAKAEREINIDAIRSGLTQALDAFFEPSRQELPHG